MTGPTGNLKVNGANEILAIIKIDLDFLLPILPGEKLLRDIDEFLIPTGRIRSKFHKTHDHSLFDFLKDSS